MKSFFLHHLFPLFVLALALPLVLSACMEPGTAPDAQATISIANPTTLSPTPTAIPYLVGAFVSESTLTSTGGSITVYVVFHHGQLPQAGGQVQLSFHDEQGGGIPTLNDQAGTETTGTDGFATFSVNLGGVPTNTPISVDVTVHFPGIAALVQRDATSFSVVSRGG